MPSKSSKRNKKGNGSKKRQDPPPVIKKDTSQNETNFSPVKPPLMNQIGFDEYQQAVTGICEYLC